jgi:hypothetical protein
MALLAALVCSAKEKHQKQSINKNSFPRIKMLTIQGVFTK